MTPGIVFSSHNQWFPMSCTASGMEMILKLHDKVDVGWFGFQQEYQNQNIGFSKISDLASFGIQATDHQSDLDTFLKTLDSQSDMGLYLLFSIPTVAYQKTFDHSYLGLGDYHIFVAGREQNRNFYRSKRFLSSADIELPDIHLTWELCRTARPDYLIHWVTYKLK
ncbi:MAG: hypothetical protein HC836_27895 [Richelia sp. RM2_1_2]|nr:hypothetical protein [Richelia sp. RM2_1_2]